MRLNVLTLIVVLALIMPLAGCGKKDEQAAAEAVQPTADMQEAPDAAVAEKSLPRKRQPTTRRLKKP
jgi:predicted small lipoprotein YifL